MKKLGIVLVLVIFLSIASFGYSPWKPSTNNCNQRFLSFYNQLKAMYDQAVQDNAGSPDFLADLGSLLAKYNPAGVWQEDAPMPTARGWLTSVECNGKIYAIGGSMNYIGYGLSTVEVYDPDTNSWSTAAPLPTARSDLAAVVYAGKIYAIGGYNNGPLSTVEVYDPDTNSWSTAAPMPTARYGLAAVVCAGKIYTIGGYNGNNQTNIVEVYNPITNQWTTITPMPTSRVELAAVVYAGKIYAIGGYNNSNGYLNTVESYDPKSYKWTTKKPMPTSRHIFGAVEYEGKIYTIGGENYVVGKERNDIRQALNIVEVYDPKTNYWTTVTPMPVKRYGLAAVKCDGKIYVIGGYNNGPLNMVEDYISGL